MAYRTVGNITGAIAPNKKAKASSGGGKGGKAGAGGRHPKQKPEVQAFNAATVDAINKAGPPGHELAHINPREGRLLEALGGSGEKDPETKIKSYEVVGKKKGTELPKGAGRGRFPGYKGDHHQVAVLTDPEVKALNTLRWADKDRGFVGGFGPEIQALADQNDRPFEFLEYRGERIPTLNGGGEDDDLSGDEGDQEGRDQINQTSGGDSGFDWAAYYAGLEAKRLKKEKEEKEKKEKERKEKEEREQREREEKEKKEKEERKIKQQEALDKRKEDRIEKERERIRQLKAEREQKEKEQEEKDRQDKAREQKEEEERIEKEAEEKAEKELKEEQDKIADEYEYDYQREDIEAGDEDRGDHGQRGESGTVYYDQTGQEGENYFKAMDKYHSGDSWDDSGYTGDYDTKDERMDASGAYEPEFETEMDAGEFGDSDYGYGDTSWEGSTLDDSETVDDQLTDFESDWQAQLDGPDDDDTDTFDSNEDAGGTTQYDPYVGEGADVDEADVDLSQDYEGDSNDPGTQPDPQPGGGGDSDPPTYGTDPSTYTGNLSEAEITALIGELDKKYGEFAGTDYEKLFHDEFADDLQEDWRAATSGAERAFLMSGDLSEFNTKGNTINDQLLALEESLGGDQQERLDTMAKNYASGPKKALYDWYKAQRDKIGNLQKDADGNLIGDADWDELDLSEWADPTDKYDPEFFQDVDYSKLYEDDPVAEDMSGDYYDPEGVDPVFTELGYTDDDDDPRTDFEQDIYGGINPNTGLPYGTTIAPEPPKPLETEPEFIDVSTHTQPGGQWGGIQPYQPLETKPEWTIDEDIQGNVSEETQDDDWSSYGDIDLDISGMDYDTSMGAVDDYNISGGYNPGDEGYVWGDDLYYQQNPNQARNPDDYSFQDQIDAYNQAFGYQPGDQEYMSAPEGEDASTMTATTEKKPKALKSAPGIIKRPGFTHQGQPEGRPIYR